MRYVTDKDSREVTDDLKKICQAASTSEAEQSLDEFERKWGGKHPAIGRQWRLRWTDIIAMFEFPPAIHTTNAINSVNSMIRKFTRNRKQYPNAESALKLVCLAIHEASKKRTMPRRWLEGRPEPLRRVV